MNKYIAKIKQLLSKTSLILSNIFIWIVNLCVVIISLACCIASFRALYNNITQQNKELSFSNLLIYILMISVTTLCIILLLKLINTTINRFKKFMGTKTKKFLLWILYLLFISTIILVSTLITPSIGALVVFGILILFMALFIYAIKRDKPKLVYFCIFIIFIYVYLLSLLPNYCA